MLKTYKFKIYNSHRTKKLVKLLNVACEIYNHCIKISRRFYKIFGVTVNFSKLKAHIAKLRNYPKYKHWKNLGSQNIQDIIERIEKSYKAFFKKIKKKQKTSTPKFKKFRNYKSITFKTNTSKDKRIPVGFSIKNNTIKILNYKFKFFKSREIEGEIKTFTLKKDPLNNFYIYIVCEVSNFDIKNNSPLVKIEGFDFGIKNFLTKSTSEIISCPYFFKEKQENIAKLNKSLSRKKRQNKKISNNYRKTRYNLAKVHNKLTNQRNDFHFKLAKKLISNYDILIFEDLNISEMKEKYNFGKKLSSYGFSEFLDITNHICNKYGKKLIKIDRYYASSKICNICNFKNKDLKLSDRTWKCPNCRTDLERDINAATNIKNEGIRNLTKVGTSTCGFDNVNLNDLHYASRIPSL